MKILKFILLLSFIVVFIPMHGQANYKEGYIITWEGDSLFGYIKSKGIKKMGTECLFKANSKDDAISYFPSDIQSYRFLNGKYYVSKKVVLNGIPQYVFLEFLINGKADLYSFKDENNIQYYIQNEGDSLIELLNTEVERIIQDEHFILEKKEYIGLLKNTFSDYPSIYPEIEKLNFETEQLIKITKDYHNLVCEDYSCIIYKKDTKVKTQIGFMTGPLYSTLISDSRPAAIDLLKKEELNWKPSFSFYLLFSQKNLFGFHERLSFNINSGFRQITYDSLNIHLNQKNLNIPVYFEYSIFNTAITPVISFGINNCFIIENKINNDPYIVTRESRISAYQLAALAGLGLEYTRNKYTFLIKYNYELGTNLIQFRNFQKYNIFYSFMRMNLNFGIKVSLDKKP
ncbi:MAG: hypothetical protein H6538_03615 [Bacteroidales bacterium]|nr:hypothetical protein [Bacteroidales bacterium]